jgi:hypothetical protein
MQEKRQTGNNALWGILLICAGLFFLLQNMGWFGNLSDLIWTALFGLGGLFFIYLFLSRYEEQWWAAIPGFTLLGLAAVVFLDNFGPAFVEPLTGSLFLGSIALGFIMIYLTNAHMWWALIPGGVLTTLAIVSGIDELPIRGFDSGGVLFLGLGLTFLVLGLLSQRTHERLSWAFIPATVLIVMGILIGANWMFMMNVLWPLVLIAVGGYWIWQNRATADARYSTRQDAKPPNKTEKLEG